MSWQRCVLYTTCGQCRTPIQVGDPIRLGDHTPVKWCATCAKTRLHEDVPADLPAQSAPQTKLKVPANFAKFSRQDTGQTLRANILNWRRDGKSHALGEDV